nr:MAG TPA: hypothetical protein [Caudoviricetes sp.]
MVIITKDDNFVKSSLIEDICIELFKTGQVDINFIKLLGGLHYYDKEFFGIKISRDEDSTLFMTVLVNVDKLISLNENFPIGLNYTSLIESVMQSNMRINQLNKDRVTNKANLAYVLNTMLEFVVHFAKHDLYKLYYAHLQIKNSFSIKVKENGIKLKSHYFDDHYADEGSYDDEYFIEAKNYTSATLAAVLMNLMCKFPNAAEMILKGER